MIKRLFVALGAIALLPAALVAAPPADPVAAFGAREEVESISLSPSGKRIAFIAPGPGPSSILYVVDAGSDAQPREALSSDGNPERLRTCSFVSETRLVCQVYMVADDAGVITPVSRIVAVDVDGKNLRMLSRRTGYYDTYVSLNGGGIVDSLPGEDGAILMTQEFVPEARQATRMSDSREGLGVDRIDTRSGSTRTVEPPKKNAVEYISDGRGTIRIYGSQGLEGDGYETGRVEYFYRAKGSRDWKPLGAISGGFSPYAVDPTLDVAYGFKRVGGRLALYSVALDGSKRETEIFAHPRVDVDNLVRIGRSGRVVGAAFATEKRQAVYFDPELKALGAALSKALPGLPLVNFIDSSVDESRLLIWAGSDTDPGRYYLYDKPGKQLTEIMLKRPELEGATLAVVKPVTYKAGDGTDVPAYLTLPAGSSGRNLPAIVMPHGGPSARDEWGFDWLAQFYAARGYAVLQPNYRGSAGYGDGWFQKNGFQSWRTAIGDINDAGRWLVSQGIADPAKLAIVGWSYGGYAALQSGVVDPGLFKAVVAIAPVTDLAQFKEDWRGWSNYRVVGDMIGSGPHVDEGSPARHARSIQAPVLLFHGERDFNVRIGQSRAMLDSLKDAGRSADLIVYPKLDHYLEDGAARVDMLRRSDSFLRSALKIGQ